MKKMTSYERITRMLEHREADRVPILETPWPSTRERWKEEGLGDVPFQEYFGLDCIGGLSVDNSPQFPAETVEETDEYRIKTTKWGMKVKNWKHKGSTPEVIDVAVKGPDDWQQAKKQMTFDDKRIPWEKLKNNWKQWRENGQFIQAGGWFGFDVTHSFFVGTERLLFALAEDPEWVKDMWQTELDLHLQLLDRVWEEGYYFDALRWPDDMGYKYSQFFSMDMYRELLKPIHQQAIDWAHNKGIKAILHSCGDVRPFIPELVDMGIDGLNPLEVKAGVDPVRVKEDWGDQILLHGGFDALLWNTPEKMIEEVKEKLPVLKENGGYIFATDHSTPDNVPLEKFGEVINLVKSIGQY